MKFIYKTVLLGSGMLYLNYYRLGVLNKMMHENMFTIDNTFEIIL